VEAGLEADSPVELSLKEGELVIASAAKRKPSLEKLLARVTRANVHREVDSGPVVGRET